MLQSQVFTDLAKKGLSPILCFNQAFKTTDMLLLALLSKIKNNVCVKKIRSLAVKMAHNAAKQTAEVLHVPRWVE